MTFDKQDAINRITTVIERSQGLHDVISKINDNTPNKKSDGLFDDELHMNELGGASYTITSSVINLFGETFINEMKEKTANEIADLRARHNESDTDYLHNFTKCPFGWTVALLNRLNIAEQYNIEIDHSHIPNSLSQQEFIAVIQNVTDRQIRSMRSVGDSAAIAQLTEDLNQASQGIAGAYAEGFDAKEYVDILRQTIGKVAGIDDCYGKQLGSALMNMLQAASIELSPKQAQNHAKTH